MSRSSPLALLALALLLPLPRPASAQAPDSLAALRPGTMLRITPVGEAARRRYGTFVALDSAALTIRRPPPWERRPIVLPLDGVRRVDVQLRPSRRGNSAMWWGLGGFVLSGVIALPAAMAAEYTTGGDGPDPLQRFVLGATAASALMGWVIAPGEQWRELPLPRAGRADAPLLPGAAAPSPAPAAWVRVPGDTTMPRPGEFVRVRVRGAATRREGRLLELDSAALLVRVVPSWARNDQRIALADVTRLDVQAHPGRRGRGAVVGASFTLLLGAVAMISAGGDAEAVFIGRGAYLVPFLASGALLGAAVAPGGEWVRAR